MALHPPGQAEDSPWTPQVDRPRNEPQMSKQKNSEDNEQLDANESAASLHKQMRNLLTERLFNWQLGARRVKHAQLAFGRLS